MKKLFFQMFVWLSPRLVVRWLVRKRWLHWSQLFSREEAENRLASTYGATGFHLYRVGHRIVDVPLEEPKTPAEREAAVAELGRLYPVTASELTETPLIGSGSYRTKDNGVSK